MVNVFDDSVLPIHRAGQTVLWEDGYPLPAHFPGAGAAEVRRDGTSYEIVRWAGA
jgi:hypothetical protein